MTDYIIRRIGELVSKGGFSFYKLRMMLKKEYNIIICKEALLKRLKRKNYGKEQ